MDAKLVCLSLWLILFMTMRMFPVEGRQRPIPDVPQWQGVRNARGLPRYGKRGADDLVSKNMGYCSDYILRIEIREHALRS
uniref:Uncharacterized protein n=1 Tax=Romanomermis culicivorax TaxID=13658 RepID=A0A915KC39_ROMCU